MVYAALYKKSVSLFYCENQKFQVFEEAFFYSLQCICVQRLLSVKKCPSLQNILSVANVSVYNIFKLSKLSNYTQSSLTFYACKLDDI